MSKNPEIAEAAITRAHEIRTYLEEKLTLEKGEELHCHVFFEPAYGDPLNGMRTSTAALLIHAWISTNNPTESYSRPIPWTKYPEGWDFQQGTGNHSTITHFDGYFLDQQDTNDTRAYRSGDIIFSPDMYSMTSD